MDERTCTFDGCTKPLYGRGLCIGHDGQRKRGVTLSPLRAKRPRGACLARDEQGRKECTACGAWKPTAEFGKIAATADHLDPRCRECAAIRSRRQARNPETLLRWRLAAHGMTAEGFAALLAEQGGACAICRESINGGYKGRLSIDHDHACCPGRESCGRCIRGLLCGPCNSGIGYLRDDVSRLRAAVAYLERSV